MYNEGEFLQGFLEEAKEHLSTIQQNLLRLEDLQAHPGQGQSETEAIEQAERVGELFRSYHTLKGLSGMVGLQDGVLLSHAMESVLRSAQNEKISLTQPVLDRLIAGTHTLAQIVNTVTQTDPAPFSINADLQAIEQLLETESSEPVQAVTPEAGGQASGRPTPAPQVTTEPTETRPAADQEWSIGDLLPELTNYPDVIKGLGELEHKKILAAAKEQQSFALAVFASSGERASRGENIDWVRQQLQEQAVIIKAVPSITNGAIHFYFLVVSPQPLAADLSFVDEIIPLAAALPEQVEPPAAPGERPAIQKESSAPFRVGTQVARPSTVVRVELDRLDALINTVSNLVQLRSRFAEGLAQLDSNPRQARRDLQYTYQQMGRSLSELRQAILRTRMVPLAETFNHMPLVVRDLARASQKEIRLHITGETIEVDKLLVERLLDPLIHLVRNAISHGIETPEERVKAGKPAQGMLELRAVPEGDHILIDVCDDGRGVNLEMISRRAAEMGKLPAGQMIAAEEVLDWLTRPGFSTRQAADLAAGRGIGLDVVQRMIRSFGGQLSMKTALNEGTTFRLRLPLTLVIVDVLVIESGEDRYAVRRDDVERILEIPAEKIVRMEGGELLANSSGYYVLHRLKDFFNTRPQGSSFAPEILATTRVEAGTARQIGLLISQGALQQETNSAAQQPVLLVDRVTKLQEMVIHPVTDPYIAQPGIGGTTELGDGSVALMIDIASLLQSKQRLNGKNNP